MLPIATILLCIALTAYWLQQRSWRNRAYAPQMFWVLPLMAVLLLLLSGNTQHTRTTARPVLLAIAADVSLSMGTMPSPAVRSGVGTRLERARQVLLPLLAELAASPQPLLVSVTAFTSRSETILAWDDDPSLAREIIEYVLSTGLLTEAGSDLAAALAGVVPLFESLPESLRDPAYPKYLLLVSDGEQTAARGNADAAMTRLRELGVQIIPLHVGLQDLPEGLPVFDDAGVFMGFEDVGGQSFSVPDEDIMRSLAGDNPQHGHFVQAGAGGAAARIVDFIGARPAGATADVGRTGMLLLLWGLLLAGLLKYT